MWLLLSAMCLVGAAEAPPAETPVAVAPVQEGLRWRDVGLGLAAGGAALATGSAVASTLVEALSTPDRESAPRDDRAVNATGLLTTGLITVGAAMLLTGGALLLDDMLAAPSPSPAAP